MISVSNTIDKLIIGPAATFALINSMPLVISSVLKGSEHSTTHFFSRCVLVGITICASAQTTIFAYEGVKTASAIIKDNITIN